MSCVNAMRGERGSRHEERELGDMNIKTNWSLTGAAFAGAALLTIQAQAADLGRSGPGDSPAYASSSWAGAYVGGHLGAAWTSGSADLATEHWHTNEGNEELRFDDYGSGHKDLSETSFLGGVHAGYNFQQSAFVYGLEGDVSFASNLDYLASVRGRLGVAAGNWLFYGTGGVAFIGGGYSGTISDANVVDVAYDTNEDNVGFVVGGGVETKLTPNWSIGVEGLYYGFDEKNYHAEDTLGKPCNFVNYSVNANGIADVGVVRARLSYHVGREYEPLK